MKLSPLFNIRKQRAIDEESEELSCEYIGKGIENILSFPKRYYVAELMQKFANIIKKMDEVTFSKFMGVIISHTKQKTIGDEEIVFILNRSRYHQEINATINYLSWNEPCTIDAWFLGCLIINIIITIFDSIYTFLLWINNIRHSISYIIPGCCETWN